MKKTIRIAVLLIYVFILMSVTAITAFADMGPKPSIKIYVVNAPEEDFYIDVLYNDNGEDKTEWIKHRYETELSSIMQSGEYTDKADILFNYYEDGWYARCGSPIGEQVIKSNENDVYDFTYSNIENDFKIIIVTESGDITVSDEVHTTRYNSTVVYDFATGEAREDFSQARKTALLEFCLTFPFTVIIELVLLKFSKNFDFVKRNVTVLLITNIITQIGLYIALNFLNVGNIVVYEIAIIAVEAVVFALCFTPRKPKQAIGFSVLANILSFVGGIIFGVYVYSLFAKLMSASTGA